MTRLATMVSWLQGTRARLFWLGICGVVLALGQPPFQAIMLAYPALVIAIFILTSSKRFFLEGWIFGTAFFATSLSWIVSPFMVEPWRHGWLAPFALLFMAAGLGLLWAVAIRVTKRLPMRPFSIALTLSIAELARGYVLTGFPWGLIGTMWVDLPVMSLAAWIGTYGVTFLTMIAAALAANALFNKGRWTAVVWIFLPVVALLGAGSLRQGVVVDRVQPYVRLIQPNAPQHLKFQREFALRNFEEAMALTAEPSDQIIDVVIWPETSMPFWVDQAEFALLELSDRANGAHVLIGANRREGRGVYNSLLVVDPNGQIASIYDKKHLVPFGEYLPFSESLSALGINGIAAFEDYGYRHGTSNPILDLGAAGRALASICYEAVFPQSMRQSEPRPNWIAHITNDAWFGKLTGPQQHLVQARLRSIELGLPIARAANTGISAIIDANGDVLGSVELNKQGRLDMALPPPFAPTLYSKWGELPLLIGIFLLGMAIWYRKRRVFH
ncbi:MAG: apolipoprotein N-acyltransferase [Paracoccaceae bacterium]|nr:apolipoprotein N-acyltransferase [Paracoccaceae bacterium]